jgi:hypothetical protein
MGLAAVSANAANAVPFNTSRRERAMAGAEMLGFVGAFIN